MLASVRPDFKQVADKVLDYLGDRRQIQLRPRVPSFLFAPEGLPSRRFRLRTWPRIQPGPIADVNL